VLSRGRRGLFSDCRILQGSTPGRRGEGTGGVQRPTPKKKNQNENARKFTLLPGEERGGKKEGGRRSLSIRFREKSRRKEKREGLLCEGANHARLRSSGKKATPFVQSGREKRERKDALLSQKKSEGNSTRSSAQEVLAALTTKGKKKKEKASLSR